MTCVTRARVDALSAGDLGLVGKLAGLQERLPFDGFPEELDHPGRSGLLRWVGLAVRR